MNNITIGGNLTREPELKFTPAGKPVSSFTIAVFQGTDKKAMFIDCEVWDDGITEMVAGLSKGTAVIVGGFLKEEYWEKEGKENNKFKVVAKEVAVSCRWQKIQVERVRKEDKE